MAFKWLKQLVVADDGLGHGERLIACVAAFVSILIVAAVSAFFLSGKDVPIMAASMGASAVLLFAVPHSRFSQPWPFVGGHLVSALVGVTCAQWIPDQVVAVAVASALALGLMLYLRCLHPPGGAAAVVAVIGGSEIQSLGYAFVLMPVALNVVLMLLIALLLNNLLPNRRYPAVAKTVKKSPLDIARNTDEIKFSDGDLEQAMRDMNAFIDVSKDDLNSIFALARMHYQKKELGNLLCKDVMVQQVIAVEYGSHLDEVWEMMQSHKVSGVPVINRAHRVEGIVTLSDLLREAEVSTHQTMGKKLQLLIKRTQGPNSEKAEVAGQVMTKKVLTVKEDQHVAELLPLFVEKDIHHIPIVNEQDRLVGMITRTTVMNILL